MEDEDAVIFDLQFPVTAAVLWNAWTNPVTILQWFGSDPAGEGCNATMDVRKGGNFSITFRDGDGTQHTCIGTYMYVDPLRKLHFSWQWKSEPGDRSFVTLLLRPAGDSTWMHFEHAGFGKASAHNYATGWQSTFSKLEELLAKTNKAD